MSMDFRKTTYKPQRADNRFRTSYSLMSQWMNRKGSAQVYRKEPLPQTFQIAMQGNAAFPPRRNPSFSAGDRYGQMSKSMDQMPPYEGQGVIRWADGVKADEVPAGHLINPRVGEIKSRYMVPSRQQPSARLVKGSRVGSTENLAKKEFHQYPPTFWRSSTDIPDFVSWGKSGR
ncbi:hypothetical protein MAR_038064 [Mya arenaria]|uniref:Uncharacterized protein n=1 Tax=Mya arenaria TaxID=6604 RepID=A0ABY7FQB0_MYAAR|nr:hypothetical protein MAR_038064 [Mya arenaria]